VSFENFLGFVGKTHDGPNPTGEPEGSSCRVGRVSVLHWNLKMGVEMTLRFCALRFDFFASSQQLGASSCRSGFGFAFPVTCGLLPVAWGNVALTKTVAATPAATDFSLSFQ